MSSASEIPPSAGKQEYAPRAIVDSKYQLRCCTSDLGITLQSLVGGYKSVFGKIK